jgi:hypothetical protein
MTAAFHVFLTNRIQTDTKVETAVKKVYTKNGKNSRGYVYPSEMIARQFADYQFNRPTANTVCSN